MPVTNVRRLKEILGLFSSPRQPTCYNDDSLKIIFDSILQGRREKII